MEGFKYCLRKVSSTRGITALSLAWDGVDKKVFFGIILVIVTAFVNDEGEGVIAFFSWC